MDPSYLFLPLGILFGLTVSYYDVKKRRIPNFFIKSTFFSACVLHATLLILSLSKLIFFPLELYKEFFISFLYSSLLVYFFWNLRLISAGDAKIFMVFFFLMLPSFFRFNHVRNFYHIVFIQNALLLALTYLIPYIFYKTSLKKMWLRFKRVLDVKSIISIILFVYSFSYLVQLFMNLLGIGSATIFLSLIFIFLFFQLFKFLFRNYLLIIMIFVGILRIALEHNKVIHFSYWSHTLLLSLLILLFRFFFMYLGYDVFSRKVRLEELKPGMILAEKIALHKEGNKIHFIKTEDYKRTLLEVMQDKIAPEIKEFEKVFNYDPKVGLSAETIKKLKDWRAEGKLNYDSFMIGESIAFAPHMFIAFLLTYIFKGDIITSIIYNLIH